MNEQPKIDNAFASSGGKASAAKLTPEERKERARVAAQARWEKEGKESIIRATHTGSITIGKITIPCAVLEDGTRVLTQEGYLKAIGRSGKPAAGRGSEVEKLAPFLDLNNLKQFVDEELADSTKPFEFQVPQGSRAYGYRADTLPKVCEVYLRARDKGKLLKSQERFAVACDLLVRGLAHVGIVALVDEATGYQNVRARQALEEILETFISKELLKWAKTFPDEFYEHMFRLKGWTYSHISTKRPILAAKLTTNIVYERLAPGVVTELKRLTPRDDKGRLKHKLFQRLTGDVGHPKLREHLASVIAIMRGFDDRKWEDFYKMLNRSLPKQLQGPSLFDSLDLPVEPTAGLV